HPKGSYAAVLDAGYGEHEICIVDLEHGTVASRVTLPEAFYGLAFNPAGTRLFASGAEYSVVHQFRFADGFLSEHRELALGTAKPAKGKEAPAGVPAGLAVSPDGRALYVANAWGAALQSLDLTTPGKVRAARFGAGDYPYAVAPAVDGRRLFVSLWGGEAV